MTKQIAITLPDEIVELIDEIVREDEARSRATVIVRAIERERRHRSATRDAAILARDGDDPDMSALAAHVVGTPIGIV